MEEYNVQTFDDNMEKQKVLRSKRKINQEVFTVLLTMDGIFLKHVTV